MSKPQLLSTDELEREFEMSPLPGAVNVNSDDNDDENENEKPDFRVSISGVPSHDKEKEKESKRVRLDLDLNAEETPQRTLNHSKSHNPTISRPMSMYSSRSKGPHHSQADPPWEYPEGYAYLCTAMEELDGSAYSVGDIGNILANLLADHAQRQSEEIDDLGSRFTRRKTVEGALLSMRSRIVITVRMLMQVAITQPDTDARNHSGGLRLVLLPFLPLLIPLAFVPSITRNSPFLMALKGSCRLILPQSIRNTMAMTNANKMLRITVQLLVFLLFLLAFAGSVTCLLLWFSGTLNLNLFGFKALTYIPPVLAFSPMSSWLVLCAVLFFNSHSIPVHLPQSIAHFLRVYRYNEMVCTKKGKDKQIKSDKTNVLEIWNGLGLSLLKRRRKWGWGFLVWPFVALIHVFLGSLELIFSSAASASSQLLTELIIVGCIACIPLVLITMAILHIVDTYLSQSRIASVFAFKFRNITTILPLSTAENVDAWLSLRRTVRGVLGYRAERLNMVQSMLMCFLIIASISNVVVGSLMQVHPSHLWPSVSLLGMFGFDILVISCVLLIGSRNTMSVNRSFSELKSVLANAQWRHWNRTSRHFTTMAISKSSHGRTPSNLSIGGQAQIKARKKLRNSQSAIFEAGTTTRLPPSPSPSLSHPSSSSGTLPDRLSLDNNNNSNSNNDNGAGESAAIAPPTVTQGRDQGQIMSEAFQIANAVNNSDVSGHLMFSVLGITNKSLLYWIVVILVLVGVLAPILLLLI